MCGIAGVLEGSSQIPVSTDLLRNMGNALIHRGPDQEGIFAQPGIGLLSRRLQILGGEAGKQPVTNENGSITAVYNGELYNYPELRQLLLDQGHQLHTGCDTEVLPHLWEEYGEGICEHLKGQFAFAIWDSRNRSLFLARDRFGICPLYWTLQEHRGGQSLLFASEIRALIATNRVRIEPDPRGIYNLFTFFALPGAITCFKGIQNLLPGRYLKVQLDPETSRPAVQEKSYWNIDFPDQGDEENGSSPEKWADQLEDTLRTAVKRRLSADDPVVSYLSGGVDSSLIVALAGQILGEPIPTFSARVHDEKLDESRFAQMVSDQTKGHATTVQFGADEVLTNYAQLVKTAEGPVIDTTCAASLLLAKAVHRQGYRVVLSGEGADEWLAGYPWYHYHRFFRAWDILPGLNLNSIPRRLIMTRMSAPPGSWAALQKAEQQMGCYNAWVDSSTLMILSRLRFLSPQLKEQLQDYDPYEQLGLPLDRVRKWHPLNQSLGWGAKILMPGMLLCAKGDRVAMHSSVEARYPFLDEDVFNLLAGIHPKWKIRGLTEKYLLRLVAQRHLPACIAWRRKAMFRGPLDVFLQHNRGWVDRMLSPDAIAHTGYFDQEAVQYWRNAFKMLRPRSLARNSVEMGMVGVISTQLWHALFINPALLEELTIPETVKRAS